MPIQTAQIKQGASLSDTRGGSRRIIRPSIRQTVSGLLFLAAILVPTASWAEPFRPREASETLEILPAPGNAVARELRAARRDLAAEPENLKQAIALARRYIALGRGEGDPRYYGYAQAALGPWWTLKEPPTAVLVLRAVVRQSQHDFDAALADLDAVLAAHPQSAQAWLTRAFILQVLGRAGEALESCRRLPPKTGSLVIATCLSRSDSLSGGAAGAYERLSDALVGSEKTEAFIRVWSLTVLAEIAAGNGEDDRAERHFRAALSLGVRDAYLLGAYADFLIDRNRASQVRDLLEGETRNDGLLLRLTLAERLLNDPAAETHAAVLAARFEASRRRGDLRHRRAEARFALHILDDKPRALRLARENWNLQKEPADARLVLEAALAARATEEARPVLDWLAETGIEDVAIRSLVRRLEEGEG